MYYFISLLLSKYAGKSQLFPYVECRKEFKETKKYMLHFNSDSYEHLNKKSLHSKVCIPYIILMNNLASSWSDLTKNLQDQKLIVSLYQSAIFVMNFLEMYQKTFFQNYSLSCKPNSCCGCSWASSLFGKTIFSTLVVIGKFCGLDSENK